MSATPTASLVLGLRVLLAYHEAAKARREYEADYPPGSRGCDPDRSAKLAILDCRAKEMLDMVPESAWRDFGLLVTP